MPNSARTADVIPFEVSFAIPGILTLTPFIFADPIYLCGLLLSAIRMAGGLMIDNVLSYPHNMKFYRASTV
jgi:hypothetical protein